MEALVEEQQEETKQWKKYIGVVLGLSSALVFSFTALLAKLLVHYHPSILGFWTFLFMALVYISSILYQTKINKLPLITTSNECNMKKIIFALCIRSVCGVTALLLFFYCVKYIDVADALVIDSSSPIFVYILACVFLREKFTILQIIFALITIIGVIFISRPPLLTGSQEYDMNSLIGITLAFGCSFFITIVIVSLKYLSNNVYHGVIQLAFGICGTILNALVLVILNTWELPCGLQDILLIIVTAILFSLGQLLITLSLFYEDAGVIGLTRIIEVLFAFIWQFAFLNVLPDFHSIIGSILILSGLSATIIRKWVETLPNEHKMKRDLEFLLK